MHALAQHASLTRNPLEVRLSYLAIITEVTPFTTLAGRQCLTKVRQQVGTPALGLQAVLDLRTGREGARIPRGQHHNVSKCELMCKHYDIAPGRQQLQVQAQKAAVEHLDILQS